MSFAIRSSYFARRPASSDPIDGGANIKHTLNGSMLFECLGWERRVERLDADNIGSYESNQFTLVYSTMTGIGVAVLITSASTQFKVVGSITNSQDGVNEIKVARFITTNRDLLKILFP